MTVIGFHLKIELCITGADPGFKKRGAQHTVFFRTAASLESRASPKKADERGGDSNTFFFGAPPASRVAQVPPKKS